MPVTTNTAGLKRIRAQLDGALDRGAARGASMIADLARQFVPVDEGDLRDTIRVSPAPGSGKGVYTVVAGGPGVNYPAFVEFGTDVSPAQPYMRPAHDAIDVAAEVAIELRKLR